MHGRRGPLPTPTTSSDIGGGDDGGGGGGGGGDALAALCSTNKQTGEPVAARASPVTVYMWPIVRRIGRPTVTAVLNDDLDRGSL